MPESMSRRGFLAKSSIAAATGAAATLAASSGLLTVQSAPGRADHPKPWQRRSRRRDAPSVTTSSRTSAMSQPERSP